MTDLTVASQNNDVDRVRLLLDHATCWSVISPCFGKTGIDVNGRDNNGFTALIVACDRGHTDVVKLLLDCKNIDVNY